MSRTVKGLLVEIGGDTSALQKALTNVNKQTSSLSKELKGINTLLKFDPKNTELVSQKQIVLNQEIGKTEEKLKALQKAKELTDEAMANGTAISQENYRNLQREIIATQNKLSDLKNEASNWTKAGDTLDNFGNKLISISSKVDKVGTALTTRVTLPLVAVAGLVTKSAIEQEAAVQQVEHIYGQASNTIKDFAENNAIAFNMSTKNAYKYSQVYGNLIQTITTDQAENAKYTQELLKASSVIASATGRTMEDVMDRIRSGLLGNTEAIEDLGVNVNVALLESTDAFKKFAGDKSWNQLDFQTQQQIRLFGILEQTTKKYGDEVNQNTGAGMQKLSAKASNLSSKLGNKLLPVANKLIDKADKFLNTLEDLDDETVENIIRIGGLIAVCGPAIKILGALGSTVGTTAKGIGNLTTFIKYMQNGTGTATDSVAKFTKGFQALISPVGLATTALGLLVVVGKAYEESVNKTVKASIEHNKQIAEEIQAEKDLIKQREEVLNSNLNEIEYTERLAKELRRIVDENGNIKAGYEDRVNFILGELNKAYGTEYKAIDGVISQYDELSNSIDNLILKKKANIILESQEEAYTTALKNESDAVSKVIQLEKDLATAREEYEKKRQDYVVGRNNVNDKQVELALKNLTSTRENLNEQKNLVETYYKDIALYEKNAVLVASENAEDWKKVSATITTTYSDKSEEAIKILDNQIAEEEKRLKILEQLNKENGENIYQAQIENSKKAIEELKRSLNAQKETSYSEYKGIGKATIQGIEAGINDEKKALNNTLSGIGKSMLTSIKASLGIHSPSKVMEDIVGKNIVLGIEKGINEERQTLLDSMRSLQEDISNPFNRTIKSNNR